MRRMLMVAVLVLAAACSDSTSGPNVDPHIGTYTLRTVSGEPLPAEVADGVLITAGRITLNDDATASYSLTGESASGGTSVTDSDEGTYSIVGTSITTTWAEGGIGALSYNGSDTISVTDSGFVLIFRK